MENIYLHMPDYDGKMNLRDEDEKLFKRTPEYNTWDAATQHQNEFGMFTTPNSKYHIIVGKLRIKNCPWCKTEPLLKEKVLGEYFNDQIKYYYECPNCGSRGPTTMVSSRIRDNELIMDEVKHMLEIRYQERSDFNDFMEKFEEE